MKYLIYKIKQYIASILAVSLVVASLPVNSQGGYCLVPPGETELGQSIIGNPTAEDKTDKQSEPGKDTVAADSAHRAGKEDVIWIRPTKHADKISRARRAFLKKEASGYVKWRNSQKDELPLYRDISSDRLTESGFWVESDETALLLLDIAGVKKGTRFFDAGCGNGRFATSVAHIFGAEVSGVETDPDLISEAKSYASWASKELGLNVNFEKADFRNSIEEMFRNDIIYYYILGTQNPEKLEKIILNNLKPGQKFVVFGESPMQPLNLLKERLDRITVVDEGGYILGTIYYNNDGDQTPITLKATVSGVAKTAVVVGIIALLSGSLASVGLIPVFWTLTGGITAGILFIHAMEADKKLGEKGEQKVLLSRIFNNNQNISVYSGFTKWKQQVKEAVSNRQFNRLFSLLTHERFHKKFSDEYAVYALQATSTALLVLFSAQLLYGIAILLTLKVAMAIIAIKILSYMDSESLIILLAASAAFFLGTPMTAAPQEYWTITEHAPTLWHALAFLAEDLAAFAGVILSYRAINSSLDFVILKTFNEKLKYPRFVNRLLTVTLYITLFSLLFFGKERLLPTEGIYNQSSYVRLSDAKGQTFYFQGPAYFSPGLNDIGRHVLSDGNGGWKSIPWLIDQELDSRISVVILAGNPDGEVGLGANVPYIHAGSTEGMLAPNALLRRMNFMSDGLEHFAWRWYLVLPSGVEIELGLAMELGLLEPEIPTVYYENHMPADTGRKINSMNVNIHILNEDFINGST